MQVKNLQDEIDDIQETINRPLNQWSGVYSRTLTDRERANCHKNTQEVLQELAEQRANEELYNGKSILRI